jgi:hypothetical protein
MTVLRYVRFFIKSLIFKMGKNLIIIYLNSNDNLKKKNPNIALPSVSTPQCGNLANATTNQRSTPRPCSRTSAAASQQHRGRSWRLNTPP